MWKCHKQAAICDAYRATNLEWLPGEFLSGSECSVAQLVFRYQISDLFTVKMFTV